jgi:hypothetical protein
MLVHANHVDGGVGCRWFGECVYLSRKRLDYPE